MTATDRLYRHKFTAVPGIFVDHTAKYREDNTSRATTLPLLRVIDRDYGVELALPTGSGKAKPWERLQAYVQHLNQESPAGTLYKVLFLTRHGFGYHNEAEARVGREAWNVSSCTSVREDWGILLNPPQDHWSHLDGDGQVVWADSELNPVVKELLRERLTDHTCDRRSARTWIAENYPDYDIEPGFTEKNELWRGDRWETEKEHTARKQEALDDIFSTDGNVFISLTLHSYAMSAILEVVNSPTFRVQEGTTVAMLVKAEEVGQAGLEVPIS
ncbi:hypothetical protein MAPG_03745 [Magnaporthiopsis poae ATCC 64411]|uniref:Phosphoglycerate mutase n=1 Tax=Magnaporthiopsis poae (strain ATCC 64411 / 73-15) TaxID=644358 RepID=A0A0C4DUV2_MAGP6|nr:hypothetical protein MAPG_03745 [Magnaporthiopsis poae ATCC 64411]